MTLAIASIGTVEALLGSLHASGIGVDVRGVRLAISDPGGCLTPYTLELVRCNKAALIDAIRLGGPCEGCGSREYFDTPIHGGRSTRRDCALCGRTWGFPIWAPQLAAKKETPGCQ